MTSRSTSATAGSRRGLPGSSATPRSPRRPRPRRARASITRRFAAGAQGHRGEKLQKSLRPCAPAAFSGPDRPRNAVRGTPGLTRWALGANWLAMSEMVTTNGAGAPLAGAAVPEGRPPLLPSRLFAGRRLVVVGGTGFLGKVWVSMFLHRFPDIDHLYLLVRPKEGQTPEERFWAQIV